MLKSKKPAANVVYRVWYDSPDGPYISYIGRTRQDLTQRIRGHFYKRVMHKALEIESAVKIDYTEFATVADMYVAEIVLINTFKPPLNSDDKAPDELTLPISFDHLEWKVWDKPALTTKWREELDRKKLRPG
jgi:hypothetical protein